MNREIVVFFSLAIMLGVLLFLGLHFEPRLAPLNPACKLEEAPRNVAEPRSNGASAAAKERKNPFAPPIEIKQVQTANKPPVKPTADLPPPPPPPPAPTLAPPKPKHINDLSEAEIPVDFQGIFALPNQPAEAHLLAKDGSTMIVHVGDELAALGVKIVQITATDVTVEVGDRRVSLRELLKKPATETPATPGTPAAPHTDGAATTPANGDISALIKKLVSSANGGKLDMNLLKELPPDQVQKLLADPQIQKLIEEQVHPQVIEKPAENAQPRPPRNNNGNGGRNRGGAAGGGDANRERVNKTEVQR